MRTVVSDHLGLAAIGLLTLAAIRYDKAIVATCVLFLVLSWRASWATFRRHRHLVAPALLLLAWIAVLTWVRDDRTSRILLVEYASYAFCFLAGLVALPAAVAPDRAARQVLYFICATAIFVLVPESILYGDYLKVFQPFGVHEGRWSSIFNNPNHYGIAMAAGIGWALSLWLEGIIAWPVLLGACAVLGFQLHLSGSRNAAAAVAIAMLLTVVALWRRRRDAGIRSKAGPAAIVPAAAAIAIAAALAAVAFAIPGSPWGRSIEVPLGIRQTAWSTFYELAIERPFAGTSPAAFLKGAEVAHGHNLPLTLAVEWGIVGLGLCLWWASGFVRSVPWTLARLVAVSPFVVGQIVDDFHYFRPFGLFAAIVAAWCATRPWPGMRQGPDVGRTAQ